MDAQTVMSAVTDENVDDMLDAAGYGITYWARGMSWEDKAKYEKDDSVFLVWDIADGEEPRPVVLSRQQVREAYAKLLDLDQKYVNRTIHDYFIDSWRDRGEDGIDAGHIDADAADCLVQVAAFGEVVYG